MLKSFKMTRDEIIVRVQNEKCTPEQIVGWLKTLPPNNNRLRPVEFKVGDVLMHPIFKHPYILLKKRKEDWICGLLTSSEDCAEILEVCQSRFFPQKYITKILFTVSEVQGNFLNVYGNPRHTAQIFKKLKELFQ